MNDLVQQNPMSVPMQNPAANALVAREVQSVQGMIISAKNFPRDQGLALKRIEGACQRTRLAEQAMYSYPRGGQTVTGPSIRLAEEIARHWGNVDTGWRVLSQTAQESIVQAWAWDLETNYRKPIEFTVPHIRFTKKGTYVLEDPRDIYEMVANQASRRQRNCILAVIPADIVDAAIEACEATLRNQGTMDEKRAKLVAAFKELDVSTEDIERRIGKKIAALSSTDYVQMQKIWKSLKDGMSDKSDWFEQVLEPEKIKKSQESVPGEGKLPHEKQADEDARQLAILDFRDTVDVFVSKGGDVKETLKHDAKMVESWELPRIKAATDILRAKLKGMK